MEDLKTELKLGELKRENLRKSLEQANGLASSVLLFTLQWKELESHFDSIQQKIEEGVAVFELREKELETTMRVSRERQEEIGLKEIELSLLSKKVDECNVELTFKEEEIGSEAELLEECSSEFKSKNQELDLVRKWVEDCSKELSLKNKQLCSVQKLISDCCEKREGKEKQLILELECLQNSIKECSNQLSMKRTELVQSQEMVEDQCKQLNENEKKLDSIKSLIQDYEEELEAKREKYEALDKSICFHAAKLDYKEKNWELHSRDDELGSLQTLILRREKQLESTKELKSVEARVKQCSKDIELKNQEFNAIQMSTEELSQELHLKEKKLSLCTKEFESKQLQLEAIQKSQEELSGTLESKEKQLDLVEKACGERLQEANMKEKHLDLLKRSLEEGLEKLETEKRQFEGRVKEFELRENRFGSVQKAFEQRSKELELKEKKLSNGLHSQVSSKNPSSFFSQAVGIANTESVNSIIPNQIKMENPENFIICRASEALSADLVVEGGTGFEESVLKISLLMLEQLLQVSPHVQPKVKADALKLASEWKARMKLNADNSIEILDEIFKLLGTTAQHQQARNVCRFTDMIPGFIQSLIERKQYIEADKCQPKQLLTLFLQDVNKVACQRCKIGKNSPEVRATDEQIAALKSVIECIKDCKLNRLEMQKMNMTFSPAPAPAVEPIVIPSGPWNQPSPVLAAQRRFLGGIHAFTPGTQPLGQFHVSGGIYATTPGAQPQGLSNKRARTDGPVINSYRPQVATVNPYIRPASPYGLGIPRNQDMAHFGRQPN
ncbi:hypothetical protein E1A91_1Z015900v1 [Gossypium mustelinum]|uniref:FRIGIDA-like protein n=1 Tax=Gossypium mustelinum TaxID=34275 RepID=A0A5C7J2D3_GOSMU|nr:hypothetical protein E1A91_1Z015900v1 [Gossypium mustelinum]